MDAQTLGALANIVKEAIAEAVAPLQDRIKELEGRLVHSAYDDSALQREVKTLRLSCENTGERLDVLESSKDYDDTALASRVQTLETLTSGDVQDDTLVDDVYWKLEDRLKALIPAAYDDSGIREELKTVAKALASVEEKISQIKAYDDTELRTWVGQQLKSVPAAYDDAWARKSFDAVQATLDTLKSVKPYDDTAVQQEIGELKKSAGDWGAMRDAFDKHVEKIELQLKAAPKPSNGADGRDALQIELLPAIDETKSYPRGTYAKHNGGTWRSYEQTHGMRGWECTQDGVAAIVPKLEGKQLVLTIVQSSGTESMLVADLPIQEYKGVYSPEGDGYAAHDTVTWAGSLWHCNKTATTAKPGDGSPDWTLAVKKGRDGREVVTVPREQKPVHIGGA